MIAKMEKKVLLSTNHLNFHHHPTNFLSLSQRSLLNQQNYPSLEKLSAQTFKHLVLWIFQQQLSSKKKYMENYEKSIFCAHQLLLPKHKKHESKRENEKEISKICWCSFVYLHCLLLLGLCIIISISTCLPAHPKTTSWRISEKKSL